MYFFSFTLISVAGLYFLKEYLDQKNNRGQVLVRYLNIYPLNIIYIKKN